MKKIFALLVVYFSLCFPVFAQENKIFTVEIVKNGDVVYKHQSVFTGIPIEIKKTNVVNYVKEVNSIESGQLKGMYETVLGEIEHGTMINFDKNTFHAVIFDDFKMKTIKVGDAIIQKPEFQTYKIDFPTKTTQGLVEVANFNGVKILYSLK